MLDPFYKAIAKVILALRNHVLGPVFGSDSGAAWGLAIVLLVPDGILGTFSPSGFARQRARWQAIWRTRFGTRHLRAEET